MDGRPTIPSLANETLRDKTDPVTKTARRRYFERRLQSESESAYGYKVALSILMLSIDNYQSILEIHGQQVADQVVIQVARLIEGELRTRDFVGRYRDDTFGIILPETTPKRANLMGTKMRLALVSSQFGDLDHPLVITTSVGVAGREASTREDWKDLTRTALKRKKAARFQGENQMVGSPIRRPEPQPTH